MSRVVQFSFDMVVDDNFDSNIFEKVVNDFGLTVKDTELPVVGFAFSDDVTDYYSKRDIADIDPLDKFPLK